MTILIASSSLGYDCNRLHQLILLPRYLNVNRRSAEYEFFGIAALKTALRQQNVSATIDDE